MPVERPPLVTSGQGAYWQVKTEADLTPGTAATVTVDTSTTFQTWAGWGGTFNEAGWTALMALSPELRQEAMSLLFSDADGIGMDWGRIPIGPSDYANERYTLSDSAGHFDITHDQSTLIPYIKAAQAVKPAGVKYWASPWTPPPWAKTDAGCDTGTGAGCLKNGDYDKGYFDTQHYQAYADFFAAWVNAYEAEGIPIHSVTPQNEPGWSQGYPTCSFGPATDSTVGAEVFTSAEVSFGPFIENYLYPAMQSTASKPGIWFGTMSNNQYFDTYWNSLTDKSKVIGVGLQWETLLQLDGSPPWSADHLVMQSEHKCGNYPWLGTQVTTREAANRDNFLPTMAPNNHAYGEESWDMMKEWIDGGVNIYSAWNMVLNTGGFNLDADRPWPQNAMIAVDEGAGTMEVTAYYYVFRHIAQYADVGATRVSATGNAIAFQNPDGSVMTAIFNDGGSPSQTTLSVDGNMVTFEIPARGWATVNL